MQLACVYAGFVSSFHYYENFYYVLSIQRLSLRRRTSFSRCVFCVLLLYAQPKKEQDQRAEVESSVSV